MIASHSLVRALVAALVVATAAGTLVACADELEPEPETELEPEAQSESEPEPEPDGSGKSDELEPDCPQDAQVCSDGSLNPEAMFHLEILSGEVSPTTLAGGGWDTGDNKPDPYVRLREPGTEDLDKATMSKLNTLTPVWNASVHWGEADDVLGVYGIEVLDSDGNAPDSMGVCEFEITVDDLLAVPAIFEFECARDADQDRAGWSIKYSITLL